MTDDSLVVRKGPFKGKRVELASTTGIQTFAEIAEDFILTLFGFDPGQYLITDLANLSDFVGVDDIEIGDMLTTIEKPMAYLLNPSHKRGSAKRGS